jgi:tetratricopeptide (TPR) repeat protein
MDSLRGEASAKQTGLPDVYSLWRYDDPAGSEGRFFDLVPTARRSGDDEYLAQLLTQIARSQVLQRRFDDGHATLDEVLKSLSERTPIARIRYLRERGRAWNDVGRAEEAAQVFKDGFELALAAKSEVLAIDAAHMLGVMPPYHQAIPWNQRAIAIAEASAEAGARGWIGTLYMNMGVNQQRIELCGSGARV